MPFGAIGAAIGGSLLADTAIGAVAGGVLGGVAGNALTGATDGGIYGALGIGGSGGGSSAPTATQGGYANGSYVPPYQQQAAGAEFTAIGQLANEQYNPYTQFGAQYASQAAQAQGLTDQATTAANQFNSQQQNLTTATNNAASNYLSSGQQGNYAQNMAALAPQYMQQGNNALQIGGQLQGQINPTLAAGNAVLNTAFDPQQALYDRTQQQTAQQAAANQASRGLAMSPYGAELSNQSNSNFNIDWQNAQLARQTAGLTAYTGANASATQLGQGANQSYAAGLADMNTGAGLNYNTAQTIYGNNQTALNNQQTSLNSQQATNQQGFQNQITGLGTQQTALQNQQNNYMTPQQILQQQITDYNTYQGLGSPSAQIAQANNANAASAAAGQSAGGVGSALSQAIAGWGQSTPTATGIASSNGAYSQNNGQTSYAGSPYDPYSTSSLQNGGGDGGAIPGSTGFTGTNPYGPVGLTNGGTIGYTDYGNNYSYGGSSDFGLTTF